MCLREGVNGNHLTRLDEGLYARILYVVLDAVDGAGRGGQQVVVLSHLTSLLLCHCHHLRQYPGGVSSKIIKMIKTTGKVMRDCTSDLRK